MKTYRLYIMILVSAGIHLGAFEIWIQSSQPIHVTTDLRSQNIHVTLNKSQPQSAVIKKQVDTRRDNKPAAKQLASKSERKTPKPLDRQVKTSTQPIQKSTEPSTLNHPATRQPSKKGALLNNDMIKALHSEFRARFKYPMLARKRGWQGKVVLALNINMQGEIANIAIKRSSGFKILDHNAVNTFKAIGMLSPNLHDRIKKSHSFNIPIVYQLNGG